MSRQRCLRAILSAGVSVMAAAGVGCEVLTPGHPKSYDVKDEVVEVNLLTALPGPSVAEVGAQDFGASALAGVVVGAAIDYVKAELEKEAERHEQQFVGNVYSDAFWSLDGIRTMPTYAGFEVVRWTRTHPKGANAKPAFKLVCALVPSKSDPRLFLIRPRVLEIEGAKAKVGIRGINFFDIFGVNTSKMTVNVDIGIDATWVEFDNATKKYSARTERIAQLNWAVNGYDLDTNKNHFEQAGSADKYVGGWFFAPPLSARKKLSQPGGPPPMPGMGPAPAETTEQKAGGAFKLTVMVTERDDSNAKAYFERLAKFVGERKPDILKAVGRLSGE